MLSSACSIQNFRKPSGQAVRLRRWSKPSTILFASGTSVNHNAFAFAVAQAVELGAELILFHAYNTLDVVA
jgi:hypothetical protein